MTLADGILLTKQFLAYDLDGYLGDEPTDAQMLGPFNWSMRTICKRARISDPSIPIALVADKGTYDLRGLASDGRGIIEPRSVVVAGLPLLDAAGSAYGLWSLAELQRSHPQWRTAPSGTPSKAVWTGTQVILHPAPNAAAVAKGGHFVSGTVMPKALTAADLATELPLPIETHECVAYLAAVRLATPTATESSQMQRLQAFAGEWMALIDELARANEGTAASWGSTYGNEGGDVLWA